MTRAKERLKQLEARNKALESEVTKLKQHIAILDHVVASKGGDITPIQAPVPTLVGTSPLWRMYWAHLIHVYLYLLRVALMLESSWIDAFDFNVWRERVAYGWDKRQSKHRYTAYTGNWGHYLHLTTTTIFETLYILFRFPLCFYVHWPFNPPWYSTLSILPTRVVRLLLQNRTPRCIVQSIGICKTTLISSFRSLPTCPLSLRSSQPVPHKCSSSAKAAEVGE